MSELKQHLENGNIRDKYKGKINHVILSVYSIIHHAVKEDATDIVIESASVDIKKDGILVGQFPLLDTSLPDNFLNSFQKILENDIVVAKYVKPQKYEDKNGFYIPKDEEYND